ncbi:hypothetical protein D3C76_1843870 [compost metagenome]
MQVAELPPLNQGQWRCPIEVSIVVCHGHKPVDVLGVAEHDPQRRVHIQQVADPG